MFVGKKGDKEKNRDIFKYFRDGGIEERTCPYFLDRREIEKFYIPKKLPLSRDAADLTFSSGMMRFGNRIFSVICNYCGKCIPLRVRVDEFKPSKSHRRVIKKNVKANVRVEVGPILYLDSMYSIYEKFILKRYGVGYLYPKNDFKKVFFDSPYKYTLQTRLYINDTIFGVGFLDLGIEGLSSFYFFYDPDYSYLSPGIFSILSEIEFAKKYGFKYYYLGYYIKELRSMNYKAQFKPVELYSTSEDRWLDFDEFMEKASF